MVCLHMAIAILSLYSYYYTEVARTQYVLVLIVLPSLLFVIGNGAVIHLPQLMDEVAKYESIGLRERLLISDRAHLGEGCSIIKLNVQ